MKDKLRYFGFSLAVTVAALVGALFGLGWSALLVMMVLILVEVTFSFENAVINAKVLKTLSPRWQTIFLTVGIVIAIFGMRVIFPIAIVTLTAGLGWKEVLDLAMNHPEEYAHKLESAHHTIAAFGGAFLLMLFLHFFFDKNKQTHWIQPLEKRLQQVGHSWLPLVLSAAVIVGLSAMPANHYAEDTLKAGLLGILTYVVVRGIEQLFGRLKDRADARSTKPAKKHNGIVVQTGWAAFATFVYLEILDASFSFDGVIGAFAITKSVVLIAAGLGVGAFWVRSLTVYMVKKGTLDKYLYLEHGAHYTVGVLALTLLLSIFLKVPEIVAGLAGVVFVGSAFWSSRREAARKGDA
jgi:hypothetical protein